VDLNGVIASLRTVAARSGLDRNDATWYLFGSILSAPRDARDIDLLVVTDSTDRALRLRTWLHDQPTPEPLHLITMTSGEEEQLAFVRNEAAVEIFPTSELGGPAAGL
jgi:hypothetical protein